MSRRRRTEEELDREVAKLRDLAEELRTRCESWLLGRERLREHQAEEREAREYRAETELAREASVRTR
ncbi:hypothetical protein [Gordonia amarae]|uniref:hypothetical protein n=1 Tax=Gordonia amarae TaxID=36821 RepID=UPI001AF33C75|nr:hypothetical protein [Gordonia amarae]QHN17936.1 hypothetical protein GII35_14060 [Gordonia amarae]QHN22457.1 hypothetical protein GII34_13805 [Gordonia amarae]